MVLARAHAPVGRDVRDAHEALDGDLGRMTARADPMPAQAAMPMRLHQAVVALLWIFLLLLPFTSSVALRNVALWGAFAIVATWMFRHGGMRARLPPAR